MSGDGSGAEGAVCGVIVEAAAAAGLTGECNERKLSKPSAVTALFSCTVEAASKDEQREREANEANMSEAATGAVPVWIGTMVLDGVCAGCCWCCTGDMLIELSTEECAEELAEVSCPAGNVKRTVFGVRSGIGVKLLE